MTRKKFNSLHKQMGLSNGHFLAFFIRGVLDNVQNDLSLMQITSIEGIKAGGDYQPNTMEQLYTACLEVVQLASQQKYDALVTILKRCPVPETNSKLIYTLNSIRVSRGVFFSGDSIKGVRHIKGMKLNPKKFVDMTEEEYRKTNFAGTRLGEIRGIHLFGSDYCENDPRPKKVNIDIAEPICDVVDEPDIEPTPYSDIGDEEAGLSEEEEMHHVEETKEWINRPHLRGDTDGKQED